MGRITPAQAGKSRQGNAGQSLQQDHPRVGGEKCGLGKTLMQLEGSPPRGRGKAHRDAGGCPAERITPAWAGKSLSLSGWSSGRQDHPRVGGEKPFTRFSEIAREGSPPHGRGKAILGSFPAGHVGITPAWAGKSSASCASWGPERDHPRMGGEKAALWAWWENNSGSPPHGRGKARHLSHGLLPCG